MKINYIELEKQLNRKLFSILITKDFPALDYPRFTPSFIHIITKKIIYLMNKKENYVHKSDNSMFINNLYLNLKPVLKKLLPYYAKYSISNLQYIIVWEGLIDLLDFLEKDINETL